METLASEVAELHKLGTGVGNQICESLDFSGLEAVESADRQTHVGELGEQQVPRTEGLLVQFVAGGLHGALDGHLLVIREQPEMVNQNVCSLLKGVVRADGAVGDNLKGKFLVVGLLLHTPVVHAPVDLADRGVDGIHGNGADGRVLVTALLGGYETAALGDGDGDFELDRRFERTDVLLQV